MTPGEFIAKWHASELKERSAAQEHFIDLCRLLNERTPAEADSTGDWYCFERMKETVDEDVQEIQQKAALVRSITSEDADNPGETERVEEAVLEVQQNPTSSPLDLAIANAFILQRVGKIDAAIEKWRSVANVAEGIDNQLAARAWFSVGYLFQEGDNKGDETEEAQQRSLSAYNEAIRLRPDYPEAYNNRGNVKQAQGQLDEVIADYNEAIRLRPDFPEAYYNRGNVKQVQGQLDEVGAM